MRARRATCTEDDIKLLKTGVVTSSDNTYPADALHVFKTNKEVDNHNLSHIKKSQSHIHEIKAIDKRKDVHTGQLTLVMPSKVSDTGGLREVVVVTMGARVMVTVNINVSDGLANGVCGTVVGTETTGDQVIVILVKFDSPRVGKDAIARILEYTGIALHTHRKTMNIVTVYRPPSQGPRIFKDRLQTLMTTLKTEKLTVLPEDFNFDLLDTPDHDILQLMAHHGFRQCVTGPTTDQGSLLDHVYVNQPVTVHVDVLDT
ncbi:hypothetical protein EYF80_045663 [Liparis tanakae]|uniref:Uncharacterized protein n=1 Tax=Liparis tanakae TaxID=230148 RepID=A0A4Z2FTT7_9TELE|nr:hypothetical protein EYF80_045663 [Liparis tanakae]